MWLSNFTQHHLSNFTDCKGFLCWNLNIKNLKSKKRKELKKKYSQIILSKIFFDNSFELFWDVFTVLFLGFLKNKARYLGDYTVCASLFWEQLYPYRWGVECSDYRSLAFYLLCRKHIWPCERDRSPVVALWYG